MTKEIITGSLQHDSDGKTDKYGKYEISEEEYKNVYTRLELSKILEIQNEASRDKLTGIIWVLNTCVFLVADYNFRLLTE